MATCTNYGAWFHYEDGTPDGVWLLLVIASGGAFPKGYLPGPLPLVTSGPYAIAFDPHQNPIIAPVLSQLNRFGTDVSIELVADALYRNGQTHIPAYTRPADDYAVGCADAQPPGTSCPPGTFYDPATELCKPLIRPILVPIPVTPTPPPGPPPTPTPLMRPFPEGDDSDELERCCAQTALQMYNIALAIQGLAQTPRDDTCCLQVVEELRVIATAMAAAVEIISAPPPPGAPPLDLTAVVTELTCVCEKLTAISTSSATVATDLAPGLKSIADAVANAKPTDVSQIVEQLKALVFEGDIPKPFIDAIVSEGFLSGADAQQLTGSPWSPAIARIFRTATWNALNWYMAGVGYTYDGKTWVIGGDGNIASRALATAIDAGIGTQDFLFLPTVKNAIADLTALIKPTVPGDVGEEIVDPDKFLTRAVSIIVDVFLVNYGIHLADLLPGDSMSRLLETLTGLLGLEELRDVQIGPLLQFGPARVAEFKAKNLYRQELPGINTLAALHARGLLSSDLYERYQGFTGVPWTLIAPTRDAAYSGLNARMLLRLAGTGLFSDADVADELTFGGMRHSSQHRLIAAAAFLGTEPQRHKFESALERIYAAGLISDSNFVEGVKSAEHNTDRYDLILRAVQLEKQIALAKEYEAAYSHEFVNGMLDAPSYQSTLEGLGLQPPDVAARMFRDESHLLVTQTLGAARLARAEQRAQALAERKAAIEAFRTGSTDPAELAASLTLTGLTPAQVAADVAYQVLARSGVLRWIYGLQKSPQEATLLREQVADLTRQREIEMLTDAQYVAALTSLSIPPRYIQTLRAGANAHISPKTKAILTPPVAP